MKLCRFALLHFDPFPEEWFPVTLDFNGVRLETAPALSNREEKRVCVISQIRLKERPEINSSNQIIFPDHERREAEQAIEAVASMIAVAENCAHSIGSPIPCAALEPENEEERKYLDMAEGIAVNTRNRSIPSGSYKVSEDLIAEAFRDRPNGVVLLAEALAHKHVTGRFHEFIRLFELAFSLTSDKLVDALSEYLKDMDRGYTRKEVYTWIKDLRDPATHADGKYQTTFVLQADIRPVIRRMEQAAYDVLLNKADWYNPSTDRKQLWSPSSGTTSPGSDIFVVAGKDAGITFESLDEFKVYPANLRVAISQMPDNLWSKWSFIRKSE